MVGNSSGKIGFAAADIYIGNIIVTTNIDGRTVEVNRTGADAGSRCQGIGATAKIQRACTGKTAVAGAAAIQYHSTGIYIDNTSACRTMRIVKHQANVRSAHAAFGVHAIVVKGATAIIVETVVAGIGIFPITRIIDR